MQKSHLKGAKMSIEKLKHNEKPKKYVTLAGFAKSGIKIDITYHIDENVTFELF